MAVFEEAVPSIRLKPPKMTQSATPSVSGNDGIDLVQHLAGTLLGGCVGQLHVNQQVNPGLR